MTERSEAQKRADRKYKETKVKRFTMDFSPADMELYEHIQKQDKKQTYVKDLIREDMKKEQP